MKRDLVITNKCKFMFMVMLLALMICVGDIHPIYAAVKLNRTSATMFVGDSLNLSVSGTTKKVTWKSSKPTVAKVTSKGKVTAKKKGSTTITATVGKKQYSCKVKVNKTFKIDADEVSIKDNKVVNAFLSEDGSVKVKIADPAICSITFGKWDGDYMPLTVVPKKVGSTTVTFSNSCNTETWTTTVKVTALPVKATFRDPVISDGAKLFIVGENTMKISFQLDRTAATVAVNIYDSYGDLVRKINVGKSSANKKKTVEWDGYNDAGEPCDGEFSYEVVANSTKTAGDSGVVYGESPFGKGTGTKEHPFLVSDIEELKLVKEYNGYYFAQDADIDMKFNSIPTLFDDVTPFTGVYDGQYEEKNYQISNVYGYNSIWGSIGEQGELRNITLNNCVLNTTGSFLANANNGLIEKCSVTGTIICSTGQQAAMMVMQNKGQIRDCVTRGNVNVVASNVVASSAMKAGGVVLHNEGTIAGCTSSVEINQQMNISSYVADCKYEIYSGGIVGEHISGFVTQCTYTGTIIAAVNLPDTMKDMDIHPGLIYSGYVAGSSQAYIDKNCMNAGMDREIKIQGTGTGTVQ